MRLNHLLRTGAAVAVLSLSSTAMLQAEIAVPNGSFEAPNAFFLGGIWPDAEQWDEFGFVDDDLSKYDDFPIPDGFTVADADTLDTGVFVNSPVDGQGQANPLYIPNGTDFQLAFMFAKSQALPGDPPIAFRQTLSNTYQAGVEYDLLFDVGESFYVPLVAATMELRLSYDDDGTLTPLAWTEISQADLPQGADRGLLLAEDVTASLAGLEADHPAVGQPIIIEILPTTSDPITSGVWVFDNVRLIPEPASLALLGVGGLALIRRR